MQRVYFISGLGADQRSFTFLDLSFCEPHYVQWITPGKDDTLQAYAAKLFHGINDEQATIVGLSFGGMLAVEIAKLFPATKVILLSSAKTFYEIPPYLRMWRYLPVYRLHNDRIKNAGGNFVLRVLGAKGKPQQQLQQAILKDSDPVFLRWALHAIVTWRNQVIPANVVHIHGSADKLLPHHFVKANHTLQGGEHLMVMDKAPEVSQLLRQLIAP